MSGFPVDPVAADGGLSVAGVAGLYIGVPVLVTAVIFLVVLRLSKPPTHPQWPILGTPTGFRRHESATEADLATATAAAAASRSRPGPLRAGPQKQTGADDAPDATTA